jgi:hypothetical protein
MRDTALLLPEPTDGPAPAEAPRPARLTVARDRRVTVFQNCYKAGQEAEVDPAFVPHDGTRNARTEYRELGLFLRMYHAGLHEVSEYTGIVSPKFGLKTKISGRNFLNFIERNPGHDVYFINPYPCDAYYAFNVWEHGEFNHAGLMTLAQELFDCAGIDCDVFGLGRNAHSTLLYCNYWVGNRRFWDRFMALNLALLQAVDKLPPRAKQGLFTIDPRYPDPVPVLPFIFERLFSTLLLLDPSIRGCAYPHSREYIIKSAELRPDQPIIYAFMEVVDEIDRRGEYDARDMAVFRSLQSLRRRITGGDAP